MDFLHSQESLTVTQWILRAVVAYFFMIIVAKVMGQRSISQLRLLDFVIALIVGNIIAHPLSDEQLGLKGSMITMTVLVFLYSLNLFASLRSNKIRKILDHPSYPLIENGKILYKNLSKAKITIDYLLSASRKEKIEDIKKISHAIWEPDGSISFFMFPQYQTVTSEDLNLIPKPFDLPRIIIKEREINYNELRSAGKDESWLLNTLKKTYNADTDNILLATINKSNELNIILYK